MNAVSVPAIVIVSLRMVAATSSTSSDPASRTVAPRRSSTSTARRADSAMWRAFVIASVAVSENSVATRRFSSWKAVPGLILFALSTPIVSEPVRNGTQMAL